MEKIAIKNRKNQKIMTVIEKSNPQKGLVFVMHGLGGYKEQPHLKTIAEAFRDNGYTTVLFDTTNTLGESDGNYEDATTTNYYEDLEDVVNWAASQSWYQETFVLAGHSLGGMCTTLFAENYPDKVKALIPLSSVVSGELSVKAHEKFEPEAFKKWQETGWRTKSGTTKRLKWSHTEDRLQYSVLAKIANLTMPVLLIVGEHDENTPVEHEKIFYEALQGPRELRIIGGAPHTFYDPIHLLEIKKIVNEWLKKI